MFRLPPVVALILLAAEVMAMVPAEPVEIGHEPQYFVDDWLVDNRWGNRSSQNVVRAFHQPVKHAGNPLIAGRGGYVQVLRDPDGGIFRMWYQTHAYVPDEDGNTPRIPRYAVGYAESEDGLAWELPEIGLHEWPDGAGNIVWTGHDGRRASSPHIIDVPDEARRGYRHVMSYTGMGGLHLVGSDDGIHWDPESVMRIAGFHSDTHNTIVWDERRQEFVLFCRAKERYADGGELRDTGRPRRVASLRSPELWTDWLADRHPSMILIPDELDLARGTNFFYGMPVFRHAGIYWGALWPFRMNSDIMTELAFSRDGVNFERLPTRPLLIDLGAEGAWDGGMVFGGVGWVEVGDEWWLYYGGHDGPHGSADRTAGIGLTMIRRGGFVSLRGPDDGGVVVTRQIRWPGGDLVLNADASDGEIAVRVSDGLRKPVEGYDYDDGEAFSGDSVAHTVRWGARSLDALAGEVIRLEIALRGADLFSIQAAQ
ncbi:MAG: hypothetical protein ACOX9R_00435 [Armatimonadota bacterium]|jgi:hypothetical protein